MLARNRSISLFIFVALSLTFFGLANAQKAQASPPTWASSWYKFITSHGDTTPPQVAITSPSGNTTFSSAQTVNITATASDDVGVTKVEFYDGSTLKGTDTTAPYTYSWPVSSSNNGTHNFTARAYDAAGNSATSSPVSLAVNIAAPVAVPPSDTTAPTVSISSPAANTTYTSAQTVTIAASASDNVGVSKVEFYDGSILKGTDTSSPFTCSWTISSSLDGTHNFTAKAYDAAGNSATSSPDTLNVNIASASTSSPGTFQFGSASYSVGEGAGKVNLTVNRVGGSGGTVTVDWGTQQNTATVNVDYQGVSWTPLTFADGETSKVVSVNIIQDTLVEGNETFNVLLNNPTGGATLGSPTTAAVTIVDDDKASADTTAPTVSISSPSANATYTSAQTVTVTASASDNVGISKVEFYDGSTLKGTDSAAPYIYAWAVSSSTDGTHSFTAKAYDAAGNSRVSSPVTLTVNISAPASTQPSSSTVFYGYDKTLGANDDSNAAPYGGVSRYVSPTGSDNGTGSISSPWQHIQYAMTHSNAGDTIYLRGGVYYSPVTINGNAPGTQQHPMEIRSYPGEWAVIDGTGSDGNGNLVRLINESWLIFRNLEIRNSDPTKNANGIYGENLTDCEFHNIYLHNNNGAGMNAKELYRVKFYNCTASDNANIQTAGNTGDGFSITSGGQNEFYRCVSIGNSDDGWDNWASVGNYYEDCISANNGKLANGNGNAFKLGKALGYSPNPDSEGGGHTLVRCISSGNRSRGFDENGTTNGITFTGCISYNNATNWHLPNANNTVTNGISFGGSGGSVGSATNVIDSMGQVFGGSVATSDYESVDVANMNNQTAGQRYFYPVVPLF